MLALIFCDIIVTLFIPVASISERFLSKDDLPCTWNREGGRWIDAWLKGNLRYEECQEFF